MIGIITTVITSSSSISAIIAVLITQFYSNFFVSQKGVIHTLRLNGFDGQVTDPQKIT